MSRHSFWLVAVVGHVLSGILPHLEAKVWPAGLSFWTPVPLQWATLLLSVREMLILCRLFPHQDLPPQRVKVWRDLCECTEEGLEG